MLNRKEILAQFTFILTTILPILMKYLTFLKQKSMPKLSAIMANPISLAKESLSHALTRRFGKC